MAIDHYAAHAFKIDDPQSLGNSLRDLLLDDKDMGEVRSAMEDLSEGDLGLSYVSKKLANLDNLLIHLLACHDDLESLTIEDDNFSQDFIEKALTLDLLHAILVIEVREVDNFVSSLQVLNTSARDKIFSCEKSTQLYNVVGGKLRDFEESLRQSYERVMEMKMQLAKLQMTSLTLNQSEWRYNAKIGLPQVPGVNLKPQMQSIDKRLVLRMLEKSLARELDLEKKLSERNHNEDDLKLKLQLTEQIGLFMEEAAEVTWARFLEAENTAEVLMGISKEMVGRLQMAHFHLNGSIKREQELKAKLQHCFEQLSAKDVAMQKLHSSNAQLLAENSELPSLREKVTKLENKLRQSESQLKEAEAFNDETQEHIREMEIVIGSLKQNVDEAERRALDAESKITELNDANMELSEELAFLKERNDKSAEKLSLLEKQLRESELQLQHAKASSEASQEQQNMLYSAIWDMENLIDELKQKASKSDIKIEDTEEKCVILTETNLELRNELDIMKARVEFLETSLSHAMVEKVASAKDIDIKTNLIMDLIMQLAAERERIQKQLFSFRKENKFLVELLQKSKKDASANFHGNECNKDGKPPSCRPDPGDATSAETSEEAAGGFSQIRSQVEEEPHSAASAGQAEMMVSVSGDDSSSSEPTLEGNSQAVAGAGRSSPTYIFVAIFVLLLSVIAASLFDKKHIVFDYFFRLLHRVA